MKQTVKLAAALISITTMLLGCGGGGDSDSEGNAASLPGLYYGDVAYTGGQTAEGLFLLSPDKEVTVIADTGYNRGSISYPDADTFSGTLIEFAMGKKVNVAISGNRTTHSLTGEARVDGTRTSVFEFQRENTFSDQPASFGSIAKSWSETYSGINTTITVTSDGSFYGHDDTGCSITGTVTIPDARYNIYKVSASVSDCGDLDSNTSGEDRNGNYSGLATLEPTGNAASRFIVAIDNGVVPGLFLFN